MELIDRRKLVSDFWKGVEDGSILSYEDTDDLMEKAPTVDAVEVVRCKDCSKEGTEECPQVHRDALFKNLYAETKPDGFCSRGERKDREGE